MTRSRRARQSCATAGRAHRDELELISGDVGGPILFFRSWLKITSSNATLHLSEAMNEA
jgi:hypothetical protein